jgi:FkbM family methyltransferase
VTRVLRSLVELALDRSPRLHGMLAGALGRRLAPLDLDVLRALPDGLVVDLDRQLALAVADDALPSTLWSILWEASRTRLIEGPCLKRVHFALGGRRFTMHLDLAESPECGYLVRNPTAKLTALLCTRRLSGRARTMLDIGANAGFHALTAGLLFERTIAFEPTPATAARLERNVAESRGSKVEVRRVALGEHRGTAAFLVEDGHCGANRIAQPSRGAPGRSTRGATIDVPVERLDDLPELAAGSKPIDFVKIDVEGHECAVLAGGRAVVARDRPELFVEFNEPEHFDRFRALLPPGYEARSPRLVVGPDGAPKVDHDPVRSGSDAVLVRDVWFVPVAGS